MEHRSQVDEEKPPNKILEGQLRESFGRVVYSHKTHEKCADILFGRLSKIKILQIILSAITTCGFILLLFGAGEVGIRIGVFVSTVLLVLNTYTLSYDLGEIAQKHKQAANDIWLIREKYLSLITDFAINGESIDEVQRSRDDLVDQLHSIYGGAPSTNIRAYKKAQKALQKDEDMTFSASEIDALLPPELRRAPE